MSKGSDGPAASTFTNPRKMGWLYKHGGSGIKSHWKKRWFIADHHYLFYYKGPSDKKPVGILCLPEYGSCHKADSKEWKKTFTFILGRGEGSQDTPDGSGGSSNSPGKDYVLYTDTEGDMNEWIKVIKEEMKPINFYANGGPASAGTVKVDQQALDEVTKAASDGPKLTHPTAQRPRVRGRRPPKRYATYHEDDKEESPPTTPSVEQKEATPILPPSPSASPKLRGHHPTIPLKPKARSQTSSPPLDRKSPKANKKMPPLPPAKPAPESEEESEKKSPKTNKKMPPLPPAKPVHENEEESETYSPKTNKKMPPLPPVKPVPEIEEVETKSADQETVPVAIPIPKQRPVPPKKPRQPSRTVSDVTVPAPRPVPVPRKRTEIGLKEGAKSPPLELKEVEEARAAAMDEVPVIEGVSPVTTVDRELDTELEDTGAHAQGQRKDGEDREEVEEEPDMKEPQPQHKEMETPAENSTRGMMPTVAVASGPLREEDEGKTCNKKAAEMKENVLQGSPPEEKSHTKKGPDNPPKPLQQESTTGAASIQSTETSQTSYEYEPMQTGVTRDRPKEVTKSPEYEEPEEWNLEPSDKPQPPQAQGGINYDIPPPPRPANTTYDVPKNVPAVEVGNKDSGTVPEPQLSVGNMANGEDVKEKSPSPVATVTDENKLKTFQIERDALGYTKVVKQRSTEKNIHVESSFSDEETATLWAGMGGTSSLDTIPSTLQQAREILRLAQVVKKEVEDMRQEVQRELEMARRERYDAELLKKNAAEILRMAKEKLHPSS